MRTAAKFLICFVTAIVIMAFTSCTKDIVEEPTSDEPNNEIGVLDSKGLENTSFQALAPKEHRLIIDDFSTGPITKLTFEDRTAVRYLQSGGTIVGGFRQLFAKINQNPFGHDMQLSIQDGLLAMTYAYDTRGTTYVNYGVDNGGLAPLGLRLEDNDYTVLKVRFAAKSTINGIYVQLFTGTSRAVYSKHVPAREGVMDFTIPLDELNIVAEDFNLNQVDYIRFLFDSRSKTGCSMAIDEIWFE